MPEPNTPLILIVDDDSTIRSVLRILLERDGYRIVEAVNGEAAVTEFKRRLPDVILMDIRMPRMDGAAACAQIQLLPNGDRTPVLMITALDDRESIDRCFDAGATDYLTKPINNAVLRQRVRRILRGRQAEEALRSSEARLASIIAISVDAILLADADLRIQLFNPGAERIFGYRADEAIGQPMERLMPDWPAMVHSEWVRDLNEMTLASWRLGSYREGVARRQDGSEFPIEISIGKIDDQARAAYTVTMRDITRRKQAEAEIKKRVAQLAALSQMGQAVTTRLDLDGVLKTVIDEVLPRLRAEGVSVLLLENQEELLFAAVNGASADVLRGQRMPANAGIAGQVLNTHQACRLRSEIDQSRVFRDIEQVTHYHAQDLIAVPLILGSDVIGVMEAVHSRPDVFLDDDLRLLEAAANWAAIAIGNARQHQALERRLRESEAMAAIGRALNETLDLETVLHLIIASARQIIPNSDRAAILVFDEDHDLVRVVTEQGRVERRLSEELNEADEDTMSRRVMHGQVIRIRDLQTEPASRPKDVAPEVRSLLAAPVHSGTARFGVISVQSTAPRAFAADDERLLVMLGDEAAIAINNARLYASEHTQRQLAEALRDTAATLTGTLDLEEVLDRILDNAGRVVPHVAANIMLAEAGVARVARCQGYAPDDTERLMAHRFSIADTTHLRQMSESPQPVVIPDTLTYSGWEPLPGSTATRSFMGASIRYKRKLLGFLNLESETPQFFLPVFADRLQVFAHQAAVAIENARLYQLEQEQFQKWQQTQATFAQAEKMAALARLATTLIEEITQPLQSIQRQLEAMYEAEHRSEQLKAGLSIARHEVERLNQITRDVMNFAQPTPEPRRAIQIEEVIQHALSLAEEPMARYHIVVTTGFEPAPLVRVAPEQMARALCSVLLNAIEATRDRGQIHIVTHAETAFVTTMIINDGPPIKLDVMPHLFEPFFTTKQGSTGLGLTIAHNVVQHHAGTLMVENLTVDRGVVVTVKLPVAKTGDLS